MLGLFVSRRSFFVLFPGLFVSWTLCLPKEAFCPISGIICLLKDVFCPIAGIICFPKEAFCPISGIICLLKEDFCPIASITSPEKGFLAYCWDYLFRWRFFVPLLGLFVSRRLFVCHISWAFCLLKEAFCPIAGIIFLPKEVFLSHCWDYLSSQLLGLLSLKEGILPMAGITCLLKEVFCPSAGIFCFQKRVFCPLLFISRRRFVFLKEQLFKSLKRSRNVNYYLLPLSCV